MPCYSFHTRSQISSQTPTRVMSSRLKSTLKEVFSASSCHPALVFPHLEIRFLKHCDKYRKSRIQVGLRKKRSFKLAKKKSNQRRRAHSSSKSKLSLKKWRILNKLRKSLSNKLVKRLRRRNPLPSNFQKHRRRHSAQSKRRSRISSRTSWNELSRRQMFKSSRQKRRLNNSRRNLRNCREFRSWTWHWRARILDSHSYW